MGDSQIPAAQSQPPAAASPGAIPTSDESNVSVGGDLRMMAHELVNLRNAVERLGAQILCVKGEMNNLRAAVADMAAFVPGSARAHAALRAGMTAPPLKRGRTGGAADAENGAEKRLRERQAGDDAFVEYACRRASGLT